MDKEMRAIDQEKKLNGIIGYQLELFGNFFTFGDSIWSWEIFKSLDDVKDWLSRYGVASGLNTDSIIKVCDIYEDDIEEWEYIESCENTTFELCPHCSNEVEIYNRAIKQVCQNCGKMILPCSICNLKECKNCPIEKDTFTFNKWVYDKEKHSFILK